MVEVVNMSARGMGVAVAGWSRVDKVNVTVGELSMI